MDYYDVCKVLCFPRYDDECCRARVEELKRLGVTHIYRFGDVVLQGGVHVIGKGHAAVIALAHHSEYGVIALKIRRVDSKRVSIEYEGFLLKKALHTGFTPKIYVYTTNVLLREYVDGCTLEELLKTHKNNRNLILRSLENLLRGALELDLAGIDLVEIYKPLKQVIYRCCEPDKPVFIDFESGRISIKPLNITKVVNFIISGSIDDTRVRDIIGLDDARLRKLIKLAKQYKSVLEGELRRFLVGEIIELLKSR